MREGIVDGFPLSFEGGLVMIREILYLIVFSLVRVVWIISLLYFVLLFAFNVWASGANRDGIYVYKGILFGVLIVLDVFIIIKYKDFFLNKTSNSKQYETDPIAQQAYPKVKDRSDK
jgi:hypothetical protein